MAVRKSGGCRICHKGHVGRLLACAVSVALFAITHTPRTCKYDMPARRQKVVTGWAGLMVSFVVFEQQAAATRRVYRCDRSLRCCAAKAATIVVVDGHEE